MIASQKKVMRFMMKERRRVLFQQSPRAGEVLSDLFLILLIFPSRLFSAPIGPLEVSLILGLFYMNL
jgi:hypothetical protein